MCVCPPQRVVTTHARSTAIVCKQFNVARQQRRLWNRVYTILNHAAAGRRFAKKYYVPFKDRWAFPSPPRIIAVRNNRRVPIGMYTFPVYSNRTLSPTVLSYTLYFHVRVGSCCKRSSVWSVRNVYAAERPDALFGGSTLQSIAGMPCYRRRGETNNEGGGDLWDYCTVNVL